MQKRSITKLVGAVVLAGSLAISMAACTSSTTSSSGCAVTKSGSASDAVKVSGKFGAKPTISGTKGLTAKTTERTVLIAGKGKAATSGSSVTLNYTVYNGTSGKVIDTTGYGTSKAAPLTLSKTQEIVGLYKAVLCSTPGTRVAAVIPPADAFGSSGQESLGITAKDSIVFVIDVKTVTVPAKALAKANGTPQSAPAGYPTVKLAASGAPTITVPKRTAPTTLEIADLKKGSGATVKSGNTVTVQYTGVVWETGAVFDSSWSRGTPASFPTTGVIPGFGKALVGQKVGSQVIAIIPPADGYGADVPPNQTTITPTSTLVFVVDILATN